MPLINMNTMIKKKAINIYCCCVEAIVEKNSASPSTAIMKTDAAINNTSMLPAKGMLKVSLPIIRPKARSANPIMKKGAGI